ncbi:hypothetical protein F5X99DRAFT_404198 [Biscogniauxia marginata]|nr:hypothetical protein F5X99DRAFT_404198 [Biscogniauxia marginata]
MSDQQVEQMQQDMIRFIEALLENLERSNAEAVAVQARIQALYDEGKPFYSKEIFADVEKQLESIDMAQPLPTITYKGVDESQVTQVLRATCPYHPAMMVNVKVRTYQDMINQVAYNWNNAVRAAAMAPITFKTLVDILLADEDEDEDGESDGDSEEKGMDYWEDQFDDIISTWIHGPEFARLILLLRACGDKINSVDKIVCFGLGYFTSDENTRRRGSRCSVQYVAALVVCEFIKIKTGRRVPIFSQEPYADDITIDILEDHGINTYVGSRRFTHGYIDVDDNTLVISIFPTVPVRSVIADIARPVIMICAGYFRDGEQQETAFWQRCGFQATPPTFDPALPRVVAMLRNDYLEAPFVREMYEEQPDIPFARIFIYVRKDKDGDAKDKDREVEGKSKQVEGKAQDAGDETQV